MMRSSRRELTTNAVWSLVAQVLSRGVFVLLSIVLARALTTSDFAAYSYFQLTVNMFASYAALGLGVSASRFFAEAGHEAPGEPLVPLGTLLSASAITTGVMALVVALVPADFVNASLSVPVGLIVAGTVAAAAGVVPGGAILGVEKYRASAAISGAAGGIMLAGSVLAARSGSVETAMNAVVAGSAFQAIAQFAVVGRAVGWRPMWVGLVPSRAQVRRTFSFVGPMMVVSLMTGASSWIVGRLILAGDDGHAAFALYSIGMQWFALVLVLPGVVSRVLLPRMVRTRRDGGVGEPGLVADTTRLVTAAAIGVGMAGLLASPLLPWVYGANFRGGLWFIAAYLAVGVIHAPLTTLSNAILAHDGQIAWMFITGVWFLLLLAVALLATRMGWGGWTGAVAQAVGATAKAVLTVAYMRRARLV